MAEVPCVSKNGQIKEKVSIPWDIKNNPEKLHGCEIFVKDKLAWIDEKKEGIYSHLS
jgi:hypothetical protein